ncbi:phospholipase D-like domain-containing protein [Massilia sp. S19_KUP03_FR1]|uniref:phospholipase D-like domain-containing protein n=1 Tax=Massilia sp. S19_KUP03_FR1 TaxID=3025503 RepID=UPI002FCDAA01
MNAHVLEAEYGAALAAVSHGVFVLGGLLLYVVSTRAGKQRRHPSAALSWVVTIALLPYLAVPLFLLFGARKIMKPAAAHALPLPAAGAAAPHWAGALLAGLGLAPAQNNATVHFHADGPAAHAALLAMLDGAQQRIVLATFILADDRVGADVVDALVRRTAAGVSVCILVEPLFRLRCGPALLARLQDAGICLRWAHARRRHRLETRLNLRYHRKLVVCDDALAWCGGRNIADEYFTHDSAGPPWEDLSFDVRGPLAGQLGALFERDWRQSGGAALHHRAGPAPPPAPAGNIPAQLVASGPDYAEENYYAVLLAGAFQARARILAVTPYFVPDDALLVAWRMACRRGVRVTLLVPARSNHRLADLARGRALRDLAAAGAEIILFPRMLHAKAVLIDDAIALCGSANLDSRSLFLNFELMVAFYGAEEIAWLTRWIEQRAAQGTPFVAREPSLPVDLAEGLVRVVGFQL